LNDIINGIAPTSQQNIYLGDQTSSSESLTSNANDLNQKMMAFNQEFRKLKEEQRNTLRR
jgi:hypothetical protein